MIDIYLTTLSIKAMFIRSLTLRIKADLNYLDKYIFNKYWFRDNVIVGVKGNVITILLRLRPP